MCRQKLNTIMVTLWVFGETGKMKKIKKITPRIGRITTQKQNSQSSDDIHLHQKRKNSINLLIAFRK